MSKNGISVEDEAKAQDALKQYNYWLAKRDEHLSYKEYTQAREAWHNAEIAYQRYQTYHPPRKVRPDKRPLWQQFFPWMVK